MPRRKPQVVHALQGTPLAEARRTLRENINALLTAANRGQRPTDTSPRFEVVAHHVLLQLSQRQPFGFYGWPEWAALAQLPQRGHAGSVCQDH